MKTHPVILCGGSETRLWPLSSKQLLPLTCEHTMLQAAVQRAAALPLHTHLQVDAPIFITNEEHRFLVRQQFPRKLPLNLVEVQSGSYLGEDDIVRFKDGYGRA